MSVQEFCRLNRSQSLRDLPLAVASTVDWSRLELKIMDLIKRFLQNDLRSMKCMERVCRRWQDSFPITEERWVRCVSSFFGNNRSVVEIVYEYCEPPLSIEYRVANILKTVQSRASEELIECLFSYTSTTLELKGCNLKTIEGLKEACLSISGDGMFEQVPPQATARHNILKIYGLQNEEPGGHAYRYFFKVVESVLREMGRRRPTNLMDSITKRQPEHCDLVMTCSGQRFSLLAVLDYHNSRPCRPVLNETEGNKFIINPRTNMPFRFIDLWYFQRAARVARREFADLHKTWVLPPGYYVPIQLVKQKASLHVYFNTYLTQFTEPHGNGLLE